MMEKTAGKLNKKILIVEDDANLCRALEEKFSDEGFKVTVAEDGKVGLSKALKEHPDVILLDIVLPGMDGLTVLKKIRDDDWGKSAAVLMLSNLSYAEYQVEAVKSDVVDYLVKTDWSLEELLDKVKDTLVRVDQS